MYFRLKLSRTLPVLRIKIRIDFTSIWNKRPVDFTCKIPPDTHYFGAEPNFINDDFGRLTGTEPFFRGVRVGVINPFSSQMTILLINLSSIGLPISWQQIYTLRWACWGVNSRDTDLQSLYDFPSVLIWWCMYLLIHQVLLIAYEYLLWIFCQNSEYILNIR